MGKRRKTEKVGIKKKLKYKKKEIKKRRRPKKVGHWKMQEIGIRRK